MVFSYKLFNPLFWHIREAMRNPDIRYLWNRGGSSSGKSVSTVQAILLAVVGGEGSALVLRKVGASVRNTVYEEFKLQARRLCLTEWLQFRENNIVCRNGMKVDFSGLDDPEKIKSVTGYRWIVLEEATEFNYEDFTQLTFRLRGKEGLQILAMFNPVSEDSWIKTKVLDTHKWTDLPADMGGKVKDPVTGMVLGKAYSTIRGKRTNRPKRIWNERKQTYEEYAPDTMELSSTYLDNFWVVGSPDGTYGYYDRQTIANYEWYKEHDYNFYRVYALGEWGSIKTGGEFLHAFDSNTHIRRVPYVDGYPVHVSIDNNVLPYISVSFFQIIGRELRQFHELCAADPDNTVTAASRMASDYLLGLGYGEVLYLYGDASTRARNTIDEAKRSFLDKFTEGLSAHWHVEERIPKDNPSVPMSGEFLNHILAGGTDMSFTVDDSCRQSIVDYNNAKKDVNGGILKARVKDKTTGQTYEKYGHLTDCLRYVTVQAFRDEYTRFSLRRKRSPQQEGDMVYFDPERNTEGVHVAYIMPDVNGRAIGMLWNVRGHYDLNAVAYRDALGTEDIARILDSWGGEAVLEGRKEYYYMGKELREAGYEIRIMEDMTAARKACVEANTEYVKRNVRFNGRHDGDAEYAEFLNAILDYEADGDYEALYAVCRAVAYMRRKYRLDVDGKT